MFNKYIYTRINTSDTKFIDKIYYDEEDMKYILEIYNINEDEDEIEIFKFNTVENLQEYLNEITKGAREEREIKESESNRKIKNETENEENISENRDDEKSSYSYEFLQFFESDGEEEGRNIIKFEINKNREKQNKKYKSEK